MLLFFSLTGGPENVTTSIGPATALHNGTLVTYRGSNVSFNCSSGPSGPSPQLTWAFRGAAGSNDSLVSIAGSQLDFRMEDIQPSAQGVYSCRAHDIISQQTVNKSAQLLVYCKYRERIHKVSTSALKMNKHCGNSQVFMTFYRFSLFTVCFNTMGCA